MTCSLRVLAAEVRFCGAKAITPGSCVRHQDSLHPPEVRELTGVCNGIWRGTEHTSTPSFACRCNRHAHQVTRGAGSIEADLIFGNSGQNLLSQWKCPMVSAPRANEFVESDRKSTRLNSSHSQISYAVFCL